MTCDTEIPNFVISLCDALHLNCSIIKNSKEGFSGPVSAATNANQERFMISFPEGFDGVLDLTEISPAATYSDEQTKPTKECMVFDKMGTDSNVDYLSVAGDLCQLHIRKGLVELVNTLFSYLS